MTDLVIISLAVAFVLTGVEELIFPIGKWRGLLALVLSTLASIATVEQKWGIVICTALACSFASMTCAMLVSTLIDSRDPRVLRGVPRRVPPL